ncbi:FUSC family protein, partial [Georgenia ruanii]|uniref:FUSC family protein n=1 Tax=Georgenia ruanii TaxID=348442 RepID=UPI0031E08377
GSTQGAGSPAARNRSPAARRAHAARQARAARETWRSRRPGWVRRTWARHPRLALAARAAMATGLAWLAAQAVPGPTADYPYYAPLGAVIATTSTLVGSVRESLQAVASIALGAAVAFGIGALVPGPGAPSVAVVVALGVLLAGWRRLGAMGSWVPTAALFTLVIGGHDPRGFIGAYTGLTLLGALIGVGVNFVFPPLPLAPAQLAAERVRRLLVDQLRDLAEGLDRDEPPDAAEWVRRRRDLAPPLRSMHDAVADADAARRWNRRSRRYDVAFRRMDRMAAALQRAALVVEDLTGTVAETERADLEEVALGPRLRPPAARALHTLAEVFAHVEGSADHTEDVTAAHDALDTFAAEVARNAAPGHFVAASVVVALRRTLAAATDPPGAGPAG